MNRWWIIFAMLLLLCTVLGSVLALTDADGKSGVTHSRFPTMLQGTDSSRHDDLLVAGWFFGALQLGLFVTTLTLGIKKAQRSTATIALGGAALIVAFTLVIVVYGRQMHVDSPRLWMSFPASTALMLFLLWPLPTYFIVVYIVMFDRWILDPTDLKQFAKLVDESGSADQTGN